MLPVKIRLARAGLGFLLVFLLLIVPSQRIPVIDQQADRYFESAMTQAGVAYATCRVINASVSVIGDSEVQLEPAGIGVSLAAGKVLDPIDDMTERLSNVLVTAIVSLGVQKLAYEMGVTLAPVVMATLLAGLSIAWIIPGQRIVKLQNMLVRLLALALVARFLLPITSIANEYLLEHFFMEEIQQANAELALDTGNWETLQAIDFPQSDGFWDTVSNSSAFIRAKAMALKDGLGQMNDNLSDIIENLLALTWLFSGIFIIQVVLLPIAVLWLLVKSIHSLFGLGLPVVSNAQAKSSSPVSPTPGDATATT